MLLPLRRLPCHRPLAVESLRNGRCLSFCQLWWSSSGVHVDPYLTALVGLLIVGVKAFTLTDIDIGSFPLSLRRAQIIVPLHGLDKRAIDFERLISRSINLSRSRA
jgi:hypothetical protein